MKPAVWIFVGLLLLLHQDYWQWDNQQLLFGAFPYALMYHMGISLTAAIGWLLATRFWWPENLDHSIGSQSESGKP
ncbi:MAG: DUF3311 domain-containing protein [Planctomycetota bacterium]|nr:DUF3311 domain-containing protein [Planctomycetota bacterium]